jgi:hypothetical protein
MMRNYTMSKKLVKFLVRDDTGRYPFDAQFMDGLTINEVREELDAMEKSWSVAFPSSVECRFEFEERMYGDGVELVLYSYREETYEDRKKQLLKDNEHADQILARDVREYNRLRVKFEGESYE